MITNLLDFDQLTDFVLSITFTLLSVLTLVLFGSYSMQKVIPTCLYLLWAVGLCALILYSIVLWGENRPFEEQRRNSVLLIIFWTLQAFW